MKTFEHIEINLGADSHTQGRGEVLSYYSNTGWELVSVIVISHQVYAYFKRERHEKEE